MVHINKYIKALLHAAGGHQGSHKAHQAGNQSLRHIRRRSHYLTKTTTWNMVSGV